MHRVPNDGDCFFSSIKVAVDVESVGCSKSGKAGGAAGELTVAEMRNWVAEETGQEQLEFYTLQARADPEERWWVLCFLFDTSSAAGVLYYDTYRPILHGLVVRFRSAGGVQE